ncbi:MAG: type II toxin-antitoxin system VapC family toxin [Candidatus Brocadiae bacterium]|nr:type II toxin-antitoxin system VapC family toxin [Candidatus Brocadiia bacterium]
MNGIDCVLDTNVVIGYLGGCDWAVATIRQKQTDGATCAVSQITRMELLAFPCLTPDEEQAVRAFLGHVAIVGLTDAIEERAIQLRRKHRLKLPDAIIAATAVELGAALVTSDTQLLGLNASDFKAENPQFPAP